GMPPGLGVFSSALASLVGRCMAVSAGLVRGIVAQEAGPPLALSWQPSEGSPPPMNRAKPFSMIREFHLADWFTLANAFCGVGSLFAVMSYLQTRELRHLYFACGLIPLALVFDVLDGRIARWRQAASAMGRELDSLADVISFGVAPAAIAYGCGMQGLYDRVVLVFFVVCRVSRLARYHLTADSH